MASRPRSRTRAKRASPQRSPRSRSRAKFPAKSALRFSVVHAADTAFVGGGLRPVFEYRDLGIRDATGGRFGAHVIRARRRLGRPMGAHRHTLDFQMVYILKGWARFYYAGTGEVTVRPGDCIHQPPGIHHDLLDYSRDLQMLEIVTPADFATASVGAKKSTSKKKRKGKR
jgi:mannose-6-phosphate isomerase-like protein (cupin superfamily)